MRISSKYRGKIFNYTMAGASILGDVTTQKCLQAVHDNNHQVLHLNGKKWHNDSHWVKFREMNQRVTLRTEEYLERYPEIKDEDIKI